MNLADLGIEREEKLKQEVKHKNEEVKAASIDILNIEKRLKEKEDKLKSQEQQLEQKQLHLSQQMKKIQEGRSELMRKDSSFGEGTSPNPFKEGQEMLINLDDQDNNTLPEFSSDNVFKTPSNIRRETIDPQINEGSILPQGSDLLRGSEQEEELAAFNTDKLDFLPTSLRKRDEDYTNEEIHIQGQDSLVFDQLEGNKPFEDSQDSFLGVKSSISVIKDEQTLNLIDSEQVAIAKEQSAIIEKLQSQIKKADLTRRSLIGTIEEKELQIRNSRYVLSGNNVNSSTHLGNQPHVRTDYYSKYGFLNNQKQLPTCYVALLIILIAGFGGRISSNFL